jgi:radical SAM-linked protein
MIRQRIRMRFRKLGDLRLISHRDLARTFERWLRRAGVRLRMSEGFHPKAKMSFPSALALGIASLEEVVEFELTEPLEIEQLGERLRPQAPPGLEVADLTLLGPGEGKAQLRRATYEIPIPPPRRARLEQRIAALREQSSYWISRDASEDPVDLQAGLEQLELCDGNLRFRLVADQPRSVRPREVLAALEVADLEHEGSFLTRTVVEIAS